MSISKRFYSFILAIIAVFALVGCGQTENPPAVEPVEGVTLSDAQALVNRAMSKFVWTEGECANVTADLFFATSNSFAPDVVISWASDNEAVIDTTGKVTRPEYGQGNATVVVTATFSINYTVDEDGNACDEVYSDTKTWTFTVIEAGEVYNLAAIKNKLASGELETGAEVTFTGTIVAKMGSNNGSQVFVHDGSDGIYVYTASDLAVGTKVQVSGVTAVYYEVFQIAKDASITVVEENVALPEVAKTTLAEHMALGKNNGKIGGTLVNVDVLLEVVTEAETGYTNVFITDPKSGDKARIYYKTEFTYIPGYNNEADYLAALQPYNGKTVNMTLVQYDIKDGEGHRLMLTSYPITEVQAAELTDEEKAQFILNGITLPSSVGAELSLPAEEGLTWAVKEGTGITIAEGVATVTPTAEAQTVVLTATATVGEVVLTKDFTVTVNPTAPEPTETTIAALLANKPTAEKAEIFVVTGIWTLDAGKETYGNGKLADEAGNTITIYGLCKDDSVVSYNGTAYTYSNNKSYASIGLNDGAVIKVGMLYTPNFDNYSAYIIEIVSAGEAPVHTHVPCDECGKCTASDCDGVDEDKCPGHAVVEDGKMELNITSLALADSSYTSGTTTVGNVGFEYIELGNYGNGIQMRNKEAEGGNRSQLWNTTAFAGGITEIVLVYNSAKSTYDNSGVFVFTFGNALGEATYTVSLDTVAGTKTYTVTPDAATYTYVKIEQGVNHTYSMYWDSITVNYDAGAGTDTPIDPEPSHTHVACPTCGLCTAEDCDGADEVKCAGHEVVEPTVITTIAEALAAADGAAVELTGNVVSLEAWNTQYSNMSVTIKDTNGDSIYVFRLGTQVGLGDNITVTGTVGSYNDAKQIAQGATAVINTVHGDNHNYVDGFCTVCESAQPVAGEETVVCDFSTLTAGTQYANETVTFGDVEISTQNKGCHFNTQLRIYDSSSNNGWAVISTTGAVTGLAFNMGYKAAALEVYGSVDGETWTLIESVATATSYKNYNVSVDSAAGYKYIKIDAVGAQIRVASISVTYVK